MELKTKLDQMLYDLVNMWFPAYEGLDPGGVTLRVMFGDPLPVDRVAVLKEILDLLAAKVISVQYAQRLVRERLGYDIPTDMMAQIVEEQGQLLDAAGGRLEAEAAATTTPAGAEI